MKLVGLYITILIEVSCNTGSVLTATGGGNSQDGDLPRDNTPLQPPCDCRWGECNMCQYIPLPEGIPVAVQQPPVPFHDPNVVNFLEHAAASGWEQDWPPLVPTDEAAAAQDSDVVTPELHATATGDEPLMHYIPGTASAPITTGVLASAPYLESNAGWSPQSAGTEGHFMGPETIVLPEMALHGIPHPPTAQYVAPIEPYAPLNVGSGLGYFVAPWFQELNPANLAEPEEYHEWYLIEPVPLVSRVDAHDVSSVGYSPGESPQLHQSSQPHLDSIQSPFDTNVEPQQPRHGPAVYSIPSGLKSGLNVDATEFVPSKDNNVAHNIDNIEDEAVGIHYGLTSTNEAGDVLGNVPAIGSSTITHRNKPSSNEASSEHDIDSNVEHFAIKLDTDTDKRVVSGSSLIHDDHSSSTEAAGKHHINPYLDTDIEENSYSDTDSEEDVWFSAISDTESEQSSHSMPRRCGECGVVDGNANTKIGPVGKNSNNEQHTSDWRTVTRRRAQDRKRQYAHKEEHRVRETNEVNVHRGASQYGNRRAHDTNVVRQPVNNPRAHDANVEGEPAQSADGEQEYWMVYD